MKKLYAILIIAVFTFLHTRGLEVGARVQNALTGLKILLIVGLVAAGFAFGKGEPGPPAAAAPFRFDFGGLKTIGLVADVDHVRLQRLERLGLHRVGGPGPDAQPAPLAPPGDGGGHAPLRSP